MALPSILLRCIARAAVKNAVNLLTLGVGGDLLDDIWKEWKREQTDTQRRGEVERLATASPAEVRPAARQAIDENRARRRGHADLVTGTVIAKGERTRSTGDRVMVVTTAAALHD